MNQIRAKKLSEGGYTVQISAPAAPQPAASGEIVMILEDILDVIPYVTALINAIVKEL